MTVAEETEPAQRCSFEDPSVWIGVAPTDLFDQYSRAYITKFPRIETPQPGGPMQDGTNSRDLAGSAEASRGAPTNTTPRPEFVLPLGAPDLESHGVVLLLRRALDLLSRYRYLLLVSVAGGVAAGWWWVDQQKPRFKATVSVMVTRKAPRVLNDVQEVVELGSNNYWSREYYDSQMELIASRDVAERVLNELDLWNDEHLHELDDRPDMTVDEKAAHMAKADTPTLLANRIEAKPVGNSALLAIEFEDTDEKFAMKVAYSIAKAYEAQNVAFKRKAVDDAIGRLKPMVVDWGKKLDESEQDMQTFEKRHNIGTIPNARKNVSERLGALNQALTSLSVDHATEAARVEALKKYVKVSNIDRLTAPELLASSNLQLLRRLIAEKRSEKAGLETRYLDQHPVMKATNRRLRSLLRSARREVRNIAATAMTKLEQIRSRQTELQSQMQGAQKDELALALIENGYAQLVQHRDRAKKRFEALNGRYTDAVLIARATANNVHVLPPALNAPQVWPRRSLVLAVAAFLALMMGIALASVLEAIDNRIKGWEDVERYVGARVIGTVPSIVAEGRRGVAMHIHANPTSPSAEALRVLRTNLTFAAVNRSLKTLLVASAMPEEGKTTVAVSTAIAIASNGNKVLLVEADMRRPQFKRVFNVEADEGLSTMLAGGGHDGITATEIENLAVLPAGPRPPNPAELLDGGRLKRVLRTLSQDFDTVIIDSPPLLPVTDALLIGSEVEGVLVVARAGRTTRPTLRGAFRLLHQVRANVFGVVLNDRGKDRRGYRYGSSYAYSYSYSYSSKDPETAS